MNVGSCNHCGHWIRHNVRVTFDNVATGVTAVFCSKRCRDQFVANLQDRHVTRGGGRNTPGRQRAIVNQVTRKSQEREQRRLDWFHEAIAPLGDKEFRAVELEEPLGLTVNTINARLRHLAIDGLVEHANGGVHKRWRLVRP